MSSERPAASASYSTKLKREERAVERSVNQRDVEQQVRHDPQPEHREYATGRRYIRLKLRCISRMSTMHLSAGRGRCRRSWRLSPSESTSVETRAQSPPERKISSPLPLLTGENRCARVGGFSGSPVTPATRSSPTLLRSPSTSYSRQYTEGSKSRRNHSR